jgi:uncharacterized repeat protein (TIGR03803 family)
LNFALAVLGSALLLVGIRATAQTVLSSMGGAAGTTPYAGVVFDSSGNLFGTTTTGGAHQSGVVFELIPQGGGVWSEVTHHNFGSSPTDGTVPYGGLILDSSGNLYGTTFTGGTFGGGTVFELTPSGGPNWVETILYNFGNGTDGAHPLAGLVFDSAGNLYGTTVGGGVIGAGTVFELTPVGGGVWSETILNSFNGGTGGSGPQAGVILDSSGDVFGTTAGGGSYGGGTAYELIKSQGYRLKILHNFGGFFDGANPYGGLISDAAGNLYGTTVNGGGYNNPEHMQGGTVFELSPGGGEAWNEVLIYEFCNHPICTDINPYDTLLMDSSGNLYGTTYGRGGFGSVFQLTPAPTPPWTETVLSGLNFNGNAGRAHSGLVFDATGNLYGTSSAGGAHNFGSVFEVTH